MATGRNVQNVIDSKGRTWGRCVSLLAALAVSADRQGSHFSQTFVDMHRTELFWLYGMRQSALQ